MIPQDTQNKEGIGLRTLAALLAAAYTASPVDAVPDLIPLLGYADDTGVIALCLLIIILVTLSKTGENNGES